MLLGQGRHKSHSSELRPEEQGVEKELELKSWAPSPHLAAPLLEDSTAVRAPALLKGLFFSRSRTLGWQLLCLMNMFGR